MSLNYLIASTDILPAGVLHLNEPLLFWNRYVTHNAVMHHIVPEVTCARALISSCVILLVLSTLHIIVRRHDSAIYETNIGPWHAPHGAGGSKFQ